LSVHHSNVRDLQRPGSCNVLTRNVPEAAMNGRTVTLTTCVVLALSACGLARSAQAGDFFSDLFGAFGARRPPPPPMASPFANPFAPVFEVPHARSSFGGGQGWCVRTCDGRYFPVQGPDRESRASSCSNFCPAAKTEVVYGGDIDNAVTDSGKPYSDLPNAFRYRDELVAGCTCNGKEPAGLAQVPVRSDPTLRRGDIVASENGLVVTRRAADRHAAANFSPVPESVRARYGRAPVVASGR
jgi:hypothetical protein